MMPVGGYSRGRAVSFVCDVVHGWGVRWGSGAVNDDVIILLGFRL